MRNAVAIKVLENSINNLEIQNEDISEQVRDIYIRADKLNEKKTENKNRITELKNAISTLSE